MSIIKKGEKAPLFNIKDQNAEDVNLENYRGKKVILSSHPLAFTSVCADQMRSLERNYDRIQEKGETVVIGLSIDPQPSKKAWAAVLNIDNVKFASDFFPLGEVAKAYGIFNEENSAGKRANIIIDEEGIVKWSKEYPQAQLPDIEEVIENL
ncbi:redoxin domain-containing protein [Anaerococcus hydrogenalis]|uniref:Peroxiredoxin n=1 Tax=Anaerococcus hydrogenalis TaxID=33029 RepID=A0A2N6UI64_9FIRM|nr:redoxin domain-containing protein [Anaerococcus hydrogenalis]MDK7694674.1 redoxin domain-containing protein [Anaerococcus hydrogenalis]MDK7696772.1 redoxin domain-containing protein [Anaerococcus hydrogenalis]MDK7707701.1 redoxin domain-containing protein [Anaerococcus hydrogenalis]PMC81319.1 peroxiredoxin [Anaerococcus hydrogenalis]